MCAMSLNGPSLARLMYSPAVVRLVNGTMNAPTMMPTSQMSASQPPMPIRFVGALSTTGSPDIPPSRIRPDAGASLGLSESSCTAHPRIEEGVEDVDGEVHEHVADRDHGDEALDFLVLTLRDRTEELGTHPGDLEDHLDDDRAANERANVEAG